MNNEIIITILIIAIVLSKIIIGILIYFLVKRKKELKSDKKLLIKKNELLKKHLEIIEKQKKELKAAEKYKIKILSIAAHDLRTPFNDLRLMIDNYALLKAHPEILSNSFSNVNAQLINIQDTIENILSWTVVHIKKPDSLIQDKFDLSKNILKIVSLFKKQMDIKGLKLSSHIPNNIYAAGNSETLNFALRNILSNAIKFSPQDSELNIQLNMDGKLAVISIKDFGKGMDPSKIEKINSGDYHQSESGTNNEKGSGIGLSLCHELLKKQEWKMNVNSILGKGTTMQVVIPILNH